MARLNSVSGFFNYKIAKGFRSKSTLRSDRVLNSCVQIEEIRIDRNTSIPYQINFYLNWTVLEHLEELKRNNHKLKFSNAKITNLRCYVLQKAFLQLTPNSKSRKPPSRSPLTFSTCYASVNQQPIILLRSAIDLKGKISQQVQKDLYCDRQMLTRISQVHYWLISELLAQLPLKSNRCSWLVLGIFLVVSIFIGLISWYLFSFNKLLCLAIAFSFFLLLNTSLKKTLGKLMKRWLIYHLVEGFLAKNIVKRKIGLKLLSSLL